MLGNHFYIIKQTDFYPRLSPHLIMKEAPHAFPTSQILYFEIFGRLGWGDLPVFLCGSEIGYCVKWTVRYLWVWQAEPFSYLFHLGLIAQWEGSFSLTMHGQIEPIGDSSRSELKPGLVPEFQCHALTGHLCSDLAELGTSSNQPVAFFGHSPRSWRTLTYLC